LHLFWRHLEHFHRHPDGPDDGIDVEASYSFQANPYLKKPLVFIEFKTLGESHQSAVVDHGALLPRPEAIRAF
jgi:hypothetical protein